MLPKKFDPLLEKLGQCFFSKMRPFFFFALLAFPLLTAAVFLIIQNDRIQKIEERFATASAKGKIAFERKAKKERFLRRYTNPDPYFLDQRIESLLFLQNEKQQIDSLMRHPALPHKQSLQERYSFLTDGSNRLSFAEENIQTSGRIKETDEKLQYPVQVD